MNPFFPPDTMNEVDDAPHWISDIKAMAIWLGVVVLTVFVWGVIILFGLMYIGGGKANAAEIKDSQAIHAIIGEAEGEGYRGMLAVAGAIRNRNTLQGVYGLHAPRVVKHIYSTHTFLLAKKAWFASRTLDITHGATGWGSEADVAKFRKETWFPSVYFTAHIGNHYFYGTDG